MITLFGDGSGVTYTSGSVTFTKDVSITNNATIFGTVSKGSGTFVIDDPLDPKNKLLFHSFVESPDVLNTYDGTATLGAQGNAVITLPAYFIALNKDFTYQLGAVAEAMPDLHIDAEVHRSWLFGPIQFSVKGGTPHGTITWEVTGIRHDPFILANPIIPEVDKTDTTVVKRGECLVPELCK